MLRSLMATLDPSEASEAVLERAIGWARRFEALVVGMTIVDEPGLHGPEELIAGESYFRKINEGLLDDLRRGAEQTLARAARRCAEAGVAFKPLEDFGSPAASILAEVQRYDLVLLGRRTHFRAGYESEPDGTALRVLRSSPRPVVIVPETSPPAPADGPVVVGYDGSDQAAAAVGGLVATGLGRDRAVHVVAVGPDRLDAGRRAERGIDYLKSHGLAAEMEVVVDDGPPGAVLLERARALGAGLLVMGPCGKPVLRELLLGSTTRGVLAASPIPLFLHH